MYLNPLKAKLNPICHLLALLGAHHILHVSRIRVKGVRWENFDWIYLVLDRVKWRALVSIVMKLESHKILYRHLYICITAYTPRGIWNRKYLSNSRAL